MKNTATSPLAVGFYGQLYNEIVRPNQIWRVSRYFIRRWGPILEPSRFWAVVAARHLSYLSEEQNGNFKAWDNEIAGEANLSNSHYRRLKGEMGDGVSPLAIFLKKGSLSYINKGDGRVRKGRTRYTVRLDDPLTPADARQVELELRAAGINRSTQPDEIVSILKGCRQQDKSSFLAADSELSSGVFGGWQAIYVTDVLEAITSKKMGRYPAVVEQAEAMHSWLTGGDVIGRRYFRDKWLPTVGAGPAWLLTWLRSYCFLDESTGEIRDELPFSKIELAKRLGIHKNALNRWLQALERIPDQPFNFIKELSRAKQPDNSVLVTFKVGMFEPLTAVDLERFDDLVGSEPVIGSQYSVDGGATAQNERYKMNESQQATHIDERYGMNVTPVMSGGPAGNERYESATPILSTHTDERCEPSSSQIERDSETQMNGASHTFDLNDVETREQSPQMNGAYPTIEPVSALKSDHLYKHLKNLSTLTNELEESDIALLLADLGSGRDESIAQTLFGSPADFLRSIGADLGGSLTKQLIQAEIPLVTLAAWWLYALAEPGIKRPMPFTLKRAGGGHIAPESFVQLAQMSLDEWLTHMLAFELDLPNDLPGRKLWESTYADYSAEAVPFVGEMVCAVLDNIQVKSEKYKAESDDTTSDFTLQTSHSSAGDAIWAKVLERLAGDVSEMELEIFLRPARLTFEAGEWVLQAADGSAEAYLKMALQQKITDALHEVGVAGELSIVNRQSSMVNEPAAGSLTIDHRPPAADLWSDVQAELQLALPGPAWSTWLKDASLVGGNDGRYLIEVRNEQARDWVQNRFAHLIVSIMAGLLGERNFSVDVKARRA